jgi:hypothetical protein
MDLSAFSTDDLLALRQGNLSGMSDDGLMRLRAAASPRRQPRMEEPKVNPANVPGSVQIGPFDTGLSMPVGLTNTLAGLGKAAVDTGRGLGQLVGAVSGEDVRQSRQLDRPLMDTGAGFAGNMAGNIGMALTPGGAFKAASMLPAAGRAAPGLSALGGALIAPRSLGTAAAVGAGMGLVQPAENLGERVFNTGLGAAAGSLVPAAQWAGRTIRSTVEPLYASGRQAIVGRALREGAGDDAAAAVASMRAGAGEIVPGSVPTAAQAAGIPSLAALERAASAVNPTVTNEYATRMAAQNAARVAALRDIAGDAATVGAAKEARRDATEALYRQAGNTLVKVDDSLEALLRRPSMASALREAEQLAADRGIQINFTSSAPAWQQSAGMMGATKAPERFVSAEALHFLKMSLDDATNAQTAGQRGIAKNQLDAIRDNKSAFLGWLEVRVPEYGQARQTFADLSQPINAMEVGQAIQARAINPSTGNITPSAFARALNDDTARAATGQKNSTLGRVFTPAQLQQLNAISEDLGRAQFAQNAGRGVGSDTVQKLAYSNMLNQAGVPTFLRNFAPGQAVGNVLAQGSQALYSQANRQLSEQLALALLDPRRAADLMARADPATRSRIAEALRIIATPATLGLPGVVNAQQ